MTIREAARELGITPQALRSRARYRGVHLEKAPGPHGDRYLVNPSDLPLLRDDHPQDGLAGRSRETVASEYGTVPRPERTERSRGTVPPGDETVPLPAHLEVLTLLRETQRSLQQAQEQRQMSLDEMRLLERQTMALQWELTGYRRALTENAESLAEHAARTKQGEHQVEAAQLRAAQAGEERAALAQENARLRDEFEREKTDLAEGLRQAQERVSWLEQRVPGWIRRLLGAG